MSTTHDVEIFVESHFMSGPQSEEEAAEGEEYQFKYHVEFKNNGVDTVQMLSRHWVFGDAEGRTSEVKGPGAVGKTPVLEPGGTWSYDSGTRIRTPTGSIAGSFQFEVLDDASGGAPGCRVPPPLRPAASHRCPPDRPPSPAAPAS
jgi:ApaG protein